MVDGDRSLCGPDRPAAVRTPAVRQGQGAPARRPVPPQFRARRRDFYRRRLAFVRALSLRLGRRVDAFRVRRGSAGAVVPRRGPGRADPGNGRRRLPLDRGSGAVLVSVRERSSRGARHATQVLADESVVLKGIVATQLVAIVALGILTITAFEIWAPLDEHA